MPSPQSQLPPAGAVRDDLVLGLTDRRAQDHSRVGAKAAALATAAAAGLPVEDGFVVTTTGVAGLDEELLGTVGERWEALRGSAQSGLVVRSSSTGEDLETGSMAGRFRSVVGVGSWDEFVEAMCAVAASADEVPGDHRMAVLVQRQVAAAVSGVLFGIDPVSGREDRIVVEAVAGNPDRHVSGRSDATRHVVEREGALVEVVEGRHGARLGRRRLRSLAGLAAQVADLFDGPQDVEWAIDHDGSLRLLQTRPITTERRGVPDGPVLGPGPVAETFPAPIGRLEEDLWVDPLRIAIAAVLGLTGRARESEITASPIVAVVGGRVAVDLEITGEHRDAGLPWWKRLGVGRRIRLLGAAWRTGRIRAALPTLAGDIVARCDRALLDVPPLDEIDDRQLAGTLRRVGPALASLHAHEILMAGLVAPDSPRLTATSVALRVLCRAREAGLDDAEIVHEHPIVLDLVPAGIAPAEGRLPRTIALPDWSVTGHEDRPAVLREALRLRIRWVQELSARVAWELGRRLADVGTIPDPAAVATLRLDELEAIVSGTGEYQPMAEEHEPGPPLPARFRIGSTGLPIAVGDGATGGGTGAGGGSGHGPVVHDPEAVEDGSVLVVATLDPALASVLPRLSGLVAETGGVLSHLAILAREAGVATVVGFHGARGRFSPGTAVAVDGTTGAVDQIEEAS